MTPTILIAALAPLAAVVGAWLGYLATRKRDAPALDIEKHRLELDDSRAALEAWVELVAQVRSDLVEARAETVELRQSMRVLEGRLTTVSSERDDIRRQLERMEHRVETLTKLLDDCLSKTPKVIRVR